MEKKETRELVRSLTNLNKMLDENPEFDYARRADIARKAQGILHEASTISRGCPKDLRAEEIHIAAVNLFHKAIDAAYPPAFWEDYKRLKEQSSLGLVTALKFLEADPWFFRSGYIKAELIRYISRIEFPQAMAERLRHVVLTAVDSRDRREYRQYCRLGRKVDSPELRAGLSLRLQHDNPSVRRRAHWVLNACEKPR